MKLAVLLFVALLGGCASLTVTDTTPLTPAELAPAGSIDISKGGYRLSELAPQPGSHPDLLVLVAMSGGGKRSASFGYGALKGMRQVSVPFADGPQPLLRVVDAIAGVSGGSFPAAYYGLYRDQAFGNFETDFLYRDTESYIWGIYLLPWNWTWISDPLVGTNDFMERVYDRTMFHGATFADLAKLGRPMVGIGATDIAYGNPVLFTQNMFDLICSDLAKFPVSRAVAASNGFPGLFSPITLTSHAEDCRGREPGWLSHVTEAQRNDPLSRIGVEAKQSEQYLDPEKTRYLHLVDGGVSDNLALRAGATVMQNMALSTDEMRARGADRARRILILSIDGQGTQDSTVAQRRAVGGIFSLFGLVSGAQIDRYNFETLSAVNDFVHSLAGTVAKVRCSQGKIVDGARCDDVRAMLIHISLAEMVPGPEKDKLLAIPTGLSIPRSDVDQLIAAGEAAVTGSAELRAFLADYPALPIASGKGR
ncbi:MAG TPA: patatin-like phospholipase family protein [Acetobacteraceae bacterium]|nr:patatin-like phospholipase family protein [Acetobacteraceae bacterium]